MRGIQVSWSRAAEIMAAKITILLASHVAACYASARYDDDFYIYLDLE